MEHYYLTKDRITGYKTWLVREERAQATQEKYSRIVENFYCWLQGQAVTRETVTAWKNALLQQGYAPSTINTMLVALNRLFVFSGWTECLSKYLKVQRRMFRDSSRELTQREYAQLVQAARSCGNKKLALLMETICSTGIRVSEVKYITVESIQAGKAETTAFVNPFTDIHAEDYYYDAVLWAAQKGVTGGTSDTAFAPDGACTRAQIVTFLWRAQQSPAAGRTNPFADISADAYYADAVLWAVENGVAKGISSTAFAPDANCTRAQIVTFIYRCMK